MAQARLQFLLDLEDRVSPGMQKLKTNLDNFKGQVEKLQPAFKTMAAVGVAGFAGLSAVVYKGSQSLMENEYWFTRMSNVMRNTIGSTQEQIQAFKDLADANERVTTISAEATMAMLEEASSYGWTNDQVKNFLPTMNDFVGLMAGINPTAEAAQQVITGLGKASNGYAEILTKKGFILSDTQKEILELGDAQKSLAILTELLGENYNGFATDLRNTTQGQLFALQTAFDDISESIASSVMPILADLIQSLTPAINRVVEWMNENQKLVKVLVLVAGGLFAFLTVVGTIGLVLPALITGFTALGTVLGFVGTAIAFILSPIGLIVLAIGAVIAAVVLLVKHWDQVSATAASVWSGIKDAISGATQAIAEMFMKIWEGIKAAFWGYVNFIIGLWATLLDFLFPGWQEKLTLLFNKAVEIWEAIKGAFANAFNAISGVFTPWMDAISEAWNAMWTGVKEVFVEIWNSIASVFDSVVSGITSAMESLIAPIQKVINMAERALQLAGGAVKSVGGSISKTVKNIIERGASITGKAIGGPVLAGTPYIVGENGPELFMPGQSGAIAPNGRFGGGGEVNIYISGNTLLDRDAARKIGDQLVRYAKLNQRL